MTNADWQTVTAAHPCPLCGKKKHCSYSKENPDVVSCFHTDGAPVGWHKVRDLSAGAGGGVYRHGDPPRKGPTWHDKAIDYARALNSDQLGELVEALYCPARSLKALGAGWKKDERPRNGPPGVYTFPLKNGGGDVIGIAYRTQTGDKYYAKDGKAGLFIPKDLINLPDPVFIVEGASDTAALHSLGCAAVGRPGDRAGVTYLARLLKDRRVIVVGEFDANPNTGRWPGRDGAQAVADKLALAWGEPVEWAMCPDGAKDSRAWVRARVDDLGADACRRDFTAKIKKNVHREAGTGALHPESRRLIANVIDEARQIVGKNGEPKTILQAIAIPTPSIVAHLQKQAQGWPRRVGGMVFVADRPAPDPGDLPTSDDFTVFRNSDDLFGWVHRRFDLRWLGGRGESAFERHTGEPRTAVSKGEFFKAISTTVEPHYKSLEVLPHVPPLADAFYLPCKLPKSDGSALEELAANLNPETDNDRDLIIACFLTMLWGGPPGRRPAFVFTSDHGRGAGKTRTASLLAWIVGGAVTITEGEDWDRVRSRLLSDDALAKRVVLIDNIRGRLARSGLEAAITGDTIDGHRMYAGQFTRPNVLTWLFTANTPTLTKDLADRSVVIRIGAPKHGTNFEEWSETFFQERRADLIADALARLEGGAKGEVDADKRDRWGPWIMGPLATFENAAELQEYIKERRPTVDVDLRDAEDVAAVVEMIVAKAGASFTGHKVSISRGDMRDWLIAEGVVDAKLSPKGLYTRLVDLSGLEPLRGLSDMPGRGNGRRWLWTGEDAGSDPNVYPYDAEAHGGPPRHTSTPYAPRAPFLSGGAPTPPAPPPKPHEPPLAPGWTSGEPPGTGDWHDPGDVIPP